MRAQLLHLSGPRRGVTDTPEGPEVVVGTDPAADVRFPVGSGVAPRHAVISFDECGCDFLVRAVDGDVFVDHAQVRERILSHGDLLEFGAGGPKARFRVWRDKGSACKPLRRMLADAADVGQESGVVASGKTLVRDLLTQATLTLKIGFPLALVVLLGLAFATGWIGGGHSASLGFESELETMRRELAELRARTQERVTREEVEAIRTEVAARAAEIERLASVRSVVRTVLEHHRRAVGLVHGVWTLRLPEEMRNAGDEFLLDARGRRVELEYTGSAFHVGSGRIVTNRHIALPWETVAEYADPIARGFEPTMLSLTITFPGHTPIAIDPATTVVRAGDRIDVALFVADVPVGVPSLELDERSAEELRGDIVLLVGYPTGVNALLAKADDATARRIVEESKGDLGAIVRGLAENDAISPIVTRGVLSEVVGSKLVYDAETTAGGSGGPVIGSNGAVVGVNFAILRGFGGSNFGVPARFVRELLP